MSWRRIGALAAAFVVAARRSRGVERSSATYIVVIDESTCEGCGKCCDNCPVSILSLSEDKDGSKKAEVTGDAAECLGCESCVTVCENAAITVQEV